MPVSKLGMMDYCEKRDILAAGGLAPCRNLRDAMDESGVACHMSDWRAGTRRISRPRAPAWMRRHGVEWIYRLYQEPVGKFRRYVFGNPLFLWRLARSAARRSE